MKKRKLLALCSVFIVVIFLLAACAAAPGGRRATSAPAPMASPDLARQAAPTAAGGFMRGESVAMDVDMEWSATEAHADDFVMVEMEERRYASENVGSALLSPEPAPARRMIVTTFNIDAETMDFDASINFITSATHDFGGYIEMSSIDGRSIRFDDFSARSASFTVRIPSNRVHDFVSLVGGNTNVVSTMESARDITESYFDNQARLASLVNQESLLTSLLERDHAELEYILEVHRELASVRHQIERVNSEIQRMDQSVNFSTAHIRLFEVMQYRQVDDLPTSFGQRVSQATSNSWNNFVWQSQNSVINMISRLPFFMLNLLLFAFWVAVFLIVRKVIRKKKGRVRGEPTFEWLNIKALTKHGSSKKDEPGDDNS